MRALLPYLALYKRHKWMLTLGIVLAIVTLLASIGLLTLSGWFLSASAVAGVAGLYSFNYMLPAAGVRGTAITRTAGRYFERLVSQRGDIRVLQHLAHLHLVRCAGLARGELLNRVVADVDTTGSPLPARDFPDSRRVCGDCGGHAGSVGAGCPCCADAGRDHAFDAHYPAAAILPRG